MSASWVAQKAWLDEQSNVPPVSKTVRLGRYYSTAEQLLMQARLYHDDGNHAMGYIFARRWLKLAIGRDGIPAHPSYGVPSFAPKAAAAKKAGDGVMSMAVACRDACKAAFEEAESKSTAAGAVAALPAAAESAPAAAATGAQPPPPYPSIPANPSAPPPYPTLATLQPSSSSSSGGGGGAGAAAAAAATRHLPAAGVTAAFAALKLPSGNPASPSGGGGGMVASQTRTLYDSVAAPSWMPGGGGPPMPPPGVGAGTAAFHAASASAAASAASAATAARLAASSAAPLAQPRRSTGSLRQHWLPREFAQSTIDGREGSSACFIIAFLLCRAHLIPGERRPRLPSAAANEAACPPAWFAYVKERLRQGNRLYDLIQGNGRFFDFDDLGVYFDALMHTGEADLTGLEVDEQLPVFLDASPAREAEISDERKLRNVLQRFASEPENVAAVWTIAGTSMAILGGENGSFFLFDSHSHPYRQAGACVLTGGADEDAAAAAASIMTQFTRVNQPDAAVGTLTTFKRSES